MAFIVEDGTIVDGATSYVAEAFSDAYFTDLAVAEWTDATPSAKRRRSLTGPSMPPCDGAASYPGSK